MPSKFTLSDKKHRQLLLASSSTVLIATLSGSAVATGPTAPIAPQYSPNLTAMHNT